MDRRRFVPRAENLEGRRLLATSGAGSSLSTIQQRTLRIDRLPFYMQSIQPGRVLPKATIDSIQTDLRAIVGHLDRPASNTLVAFNLQLRAIQSHASLQRSDAAGLNNAFRQVLASADMPRDLISSFSANMNTLAQVASRQTNPVFLASNDYALVLQVILGVGRPLPAPTRPRLASGDNTGGKNDYITTVRQPTLVGSYEPGTTIRIVGPRGVIMGTAAVQPSGQYAVKFAKPLSIGQHTFRLNAKDANGAISLPSPAFTLTIQG